MGEETETSSTSQDKEKDATCARQHCTEEEEEGISDFLLYLFGAFSKKVGFSLQEACNTVGIVERLLFWILLCFFTYSPRIPFNSYFCGSCICNVFL